jgi:hypothetical protein
LLKEAKIDDGDGDGKGDKMVAVGEVLSFPRLPGPKNLKGGSHSKWWALGLATRPRQFTVKRLHLL